MKALLAILLISAAYTAAATSEEHVFLVVETAKLSELVNQADGLENVSTRAIEYISSFRGKCSPIVFSLRDEFHNYSFEFKISGDSVEFNVNRSSRRTKKSIECSGKAVLSTTPGTLTAKSNWEKDPYVVLFYKTAKKE